MKKLIAWVYLICVPLFLVGSGSWFIAKETDQAFYTVWVDFLSNLATYAAFYVVVAIIWFLLVKSLKVIKKD